MCWFKPKKVGVFGKKPLCTNRHHPWKTCMSKGKGSLHLDRFGIRHVNTIKLKKLGAIPRALGQPGLLVEHTSLGKCWQGDFGGKPPNSAGCEICLSPHPVLSRAVRCVLITLKSLCLAQPGIEVFEVQNIPSPMGSRVGFPQLGAREDLKQLPG